MTAVVHHLRVAAAYPWLAATCVLAVAYLAARAVAETIAGVPCG